MEYGVAAPTSGVPSKPSALFEHSRRILHHSVVTTLNRNSISNIEHMQLQPQPQPQQLAKEKK